MDAFPLFAKSSTEHLGQSGSAPPATAAAQAAGSGSQPLSRLASHGSSAQGSHYTSTSSGSLEEHSTRGAAAKGQKGSKKRPTSAKSRTLRRRETNSSAQRRFRERQKERQAKMVDDLADAQKLVIELQAANAALTAKVERLQSAGQMEQAQGSRSGLGVAPGVWQEPWNGSAGSSESLQEPVTITLDEHNPRVLSGREVHMLSGAECSSLWREIVVQLQSGLAALTHSPHALDRVTKLVQEAQQVLTAFSVRNPLCLQHLNAHFPETMFQPEAGRPDRAAAQAALAACQLTQAQQQDLAALRRAYLVCWGHLQQQQLLWETLRPLQDPSAANAGADQGQLHKVMIEKRRLHAALMKAVMNGVLTTTQLAQHIVRCWPFTPDPMALLELAAQQGSLHRSNSLPTEVVADSVALDQGLQLIRYAEDLHLPHEMGRHIPFVQLHLELA